MKGPCMETKVWAGSKGAWRVVVLRVHSVTRRKRPRNTRPSTLQRLATALILMIIVVRLFISTREGTKNNGRTDIYAHLSPKETTRNERSCTWNAAGFGTSPPVPSDLDSRGTKGLASELDPLFNASWLMLEGREPLLQPVTAFQYQMLEDIFFYQGQPKQGRALINPLCM